jgi:hypothetical protein
VGVPPPVPQVGHRAENLGERLLNLQVTLVSHSTDLNPTRCFKHSVLGERAHQDLEVADIAWVIGAAVVLIGFPRSMSTAGLWALGLVTFTVADFAAVQAIGLRRTETTA